MPPSAVNRGMMPSGQGQRGAGALPQQFDPRMLAAKEMLLKSELLKVRALRSLMGGGQGPKRPRNGG